MLSKKGLFPLATRKLDLANLLSAVADRTSVSGELITGASLFLTGPCFGETLRLKSNLYPSLKF